MTQPAAPAAMPKELKAPAKGARKAAVALSVAAVIFSLGFGYCLRQGLWMLRDPSTFDEKVYFHWIGYAIGLLTVALLLRMCAAISELLWLERTWQNLPEDLQKVGPVDKVSSGLVIGISFVPGIAWLWKLGLINGVTSGFEEMRKRHPFDAKVPRTLGLAAVVIGWIPILNVYVAPFLWEMFATRMEKVIHELMASRAARAPAGGPLAIGPTSSSPT